MKWASMSTDSGSALLFKSIQGFPLGLLFSHIQTMAGRAYSESVDNSAPQRINTCTNFQSCQLAKDILIDKVLVMKGLQELAQVLAAPMR